MATRSSMLLLRFHEQDSEFGVTRSTLQELSKKLKISEGEVVHLAVSRMLRERFPAYALMTALFQIVPLRSCAPMPALHSQLLK